MPKPQVRYCAIPVDGEKTGDISVMTYGNGAYVAYTYDALDRVIAVCYNGIETVEYVYSSNGNITLIKDNQNDIEYKYYYSADGVLLNEKVVEDGVASYSRFYQYDDNGQLIKKDVYYSASSAVTVYYTYNKDGSITKIDDTIFNINYGYDEFGRLSTTNIDGDVSTSIISKTYTYSDTDTQASTRISNELMYANGLTYNTSYTYGANGNITSIVKNNKSVSYEYDLSGQLIRENNQSLGYTYLYYYDESGNLRYKETREYTLEATSVIEQTMPLTFELYTVDSDWGDQLTKYNGGNIYYDSMGNPIRYYNGLEFTWENVNNLVSISDGWWINSYTYNDQGVRTSKTVNGVTHTYHLDGTRILSEEYENKLILYIYDEAGSIIGMAYRTNSYASGVFDYYLFTKNLQGDIIGIYDTNGNCVASYTYNAWGECTVINNTSANIGNINPFRYRGYYYDTETGFYYLNARYYDPQIKRFISPDTFDNLGANGDLNSFNLYAYCSNNPVMYVDPTGEIAGWVIALIVIGVIIAVAKVANVVAVVKTNNEVENSDVAPMSDEEFAKYDEDTESTAGMTSEQQLAYVRKLKENDSQSGNNKLTQWSEAQMLRELRYHENGFYVCSWFGGDPSEEGTWTYRLNHVDFEEDKNVKTYLYLFIGNVITWGY